MEQQTNGTVGTLERAEELDVQSIERRLDAVIKQQEEMNEKLDKLIAFCEQLANIVENFQLPPMIANMLGVPQQHNGT